jgi:hypothetical protein
MGKTNKPKEEKKSAKATPKTIAKPTKAAKAPTKA